ncbi:MAG: response regulator, partial [Deltaproteobacteria bacterium]|nr:response regulator [Deltaproteobacteria bacterium]
MGEAPGEHLGPLEWSDVEILVVEDSLTQALCLQQMLEKAGYRVSIAGNGQEALRYLESKLPTLVITDVVMPEMDGYELCKRIKSNKRLSQTPVVLVTFLSDPGDVLRGLECGADNFITKPYQERELISRIHYLLINNDLRRRSAAGVGLEIFFAGRR